MREQVPVVTGDIDVREIHWWFHSLDHKYTLHTWHVENASDFGSNPKWVLVNKRIMWPCLP